MAFNVSSIIDKLWMMMSPKFWGYRCHNPYKIIVHTILNPENFKHDISTSFLLPAPPLLDPFRYFLQSEFWTKSPDNLRLCNQNSLSKLYWLKCNHSRVEHAVQGEHNVCVLDNSSHATGPGCLRKLGFWFSRFLPNFNLVLTIFWTWLWSVLNLILIYFGPGFTLFSTWFFFTYFEPSFDLFWIWFWSISTWFKSGLLLGMQVRNRISLYRVYRES